MILQNFVLLFRHEAVPEVENIPKGLGFGMEFVEKYIIDEYLPECKAFYFAFFRKRTTV